MKEVYNGYILGSEIKKKVTYEKETHKQTLTGKLIKSCIIPTNVSLK